MSLPDTRHRLVLNRFEDGGVTVVAAGDGFFAITGGGIGWTYARGAIDELVDRDVADGIAPAHARAFRRAVAFGGLTEGEAWAVCRDRDWARRGHAFALFDRDAFPDRWFRDAWRRSANGGPIYVDILRAQAIQFARIRAAVAAENERRSFDLFGKAEIAFEADRWRRACLAARDDDELRSAWPEEIAHPMRKIAS